MTATTLPSNRRYARVLSAKLEEDTRALAYRMSLRPPASAEYDAMCTEWARMSAELILRWSGLVKQPRVRARG